MSSAKNIFIINDYPTSTKNGIGAFTRELIFSLKNKYNICLIYFNYPVDEFAIRLKENVKEILFPPLVDKSFLFHTNIINALLKLHISDLHYNLFINNNAPCESFYQSIKEGFPKSKIMHIIHDVTWRFPLRGDYRGLQQILANKNNPNYIPIVNGMNDERATYTLADALVCLCSDTFYSLQKDYNMPCDKINLIPNGLRDFTNSVPVDKNNLKKSFYIDPQDKVILFVGRIDNYKGTDFLIKAFKHLLKYYANIRLVIAGSISDSMLKDFNSILSKITFTGFLEKEELYKWYKLSDIGIIPSYIEQCTYTGIEMAMFGLPIITTDGYGVRNMFKNGKNAKVVSLKFRKNPDYLKNGLIGAISELLSSEEELANFALKSRENYLNNYEITKMSSSYISLIDRLFANN